MDRMMKKDERNYIMAYCGNCGSVIADDAKFCENCGAPHMQAVAQAAQAEPEQQNSNSSSQQAQPQETYSSYSYGGGQQSQTQQSYSYSAGQQAGSSDGTGAAYGSASAGNIGGPTPGVGFVEAVQTCFSKYATFEGRARRSEYWFYTLFIWLVQVVLAVVGMIVLGTSPEDGPNILMSIFSLATLVPSLAVFWRRMHDIGKSGAWFFLNLVPCIGSIVLLVFELTDSQPGENQFGMSPKYPVV
jgi:uncharacterized membrane protein YhaH (DUF805 family)